MHLGYNALLKNAIISIGNRIENYNPIVKH